MTSRRTPTKLDRFIAKRKSRWPYHGRVIHARLARDEIINLAFVTFSFIKAELEITVIVLVITG